MSEVNEVILHIGTPKTGTTALQYAFYSLMTQMQDRGICYPDLVGSGHGWTIERGMGSGNGNITARVDWESEDKTDRVRQLLNDAVAKCPDSDRILISSEVISKCAGNERFWQMLGDAKSAVSQKIKVVIYLRNPFPWFLTCYQQLVSGSGFSGDLDDYVDVFLQNENDLAFNIQLNIKSIAHWAEVYGIDLQLLQYEAALPNLEQHFFKEVLDLDLVEFGFEPRVVNTSMNIMEVYFQRGVNSVSTSLGSLLHFERIDSLLGENRRKLSFKEQKHVLSDISRQTLEKAFEKYYRDMADLVSFAEDINYAIDHNSVLFSIDETEAKYREQFFELGKFVASSYVNGYINWDWKKKTGEIV
ncbi:MAG: hypothetical protein NT032_01265 [Actinobacteria bacterium]|nr:hypothetical protein [Actinomycetota bacterium]